MSIKSAIKSLFKKKAKSFNPFETLNEAYCKNVAEADSAGYADKLKESTDLFFRLVNDCLCDENSVHFEDVEYLDGYFLFAFGSNSVVHFHIKECPGWKFGIWWQIPDGSNPKQRYIDGEFFAQYEENIDKFKPSRSEICTKITARPWNEKAECSGVDAVSCITFIRDEPYLAFCRDYWGWDYNTKYHTREEAKSEFDVWKRNKDEQDSNEAFLDEKILSFVKEKILPTVSDSHILDRGEAWHPRYLVVAPYQSNKSIVDKTGEYEWLDENDDEGAKIADEYRTLLKECEEYSVEHKVYWYCPIRETISFYDADDQSNF